MVLNYSRALAQDFAGQCAYGSRYFLYMGRSTVGNVIFFFSPPKQNNPSKMLWSLSQPSSTRPSAGQCYRLHNWQDWRSFSLLMTTQPWPWTMASSGGRTLTTRQRCQCLIWFRRQADKLITAILLIAWYRFSSRAWCSMIWGRAAQLQPSSPIRQWKLRSLAPSPSYKSEVLGECTGPSLEVPLPQLYLLYYTILVRTLWIYCVNSS